MPVRKANPLPKWVKGNRRHWHWGQRELGKGRCALPTHRVDARDGEWFVAVRQWRIALEVAHGCSGDPRAVFYIWKSRFSLIANIVVLLFVSLIMIMANGSRVPAVTNPSMHAMHGRRHAGLLPNTMRKWEACFDSSGRCEYTIVAVTRHSMHESASCRPRHPLGLLGRPGGQNHHNSNQNMAQRSRMESEGFSQAQIDPEGELDSLQQGKTWWGEGQGENEVQQGTIERAPVR